MSIETLMGKISFIDRDKEKATIEYLLNGKKKSIRGNISEQEQMKLKEQKLIKKTHRFQVGDEVSFISALTPRGDRMIADRIEYRFNNALDNLVNKSVVENRFAGYLKKVGDEYFVKETGSYIFFPLKLSPWERKPGENELNEPFFFKLENTDKPAKAFATPFKSTYIPEYLAALRLFKNKTPVNATVYKVTPHGIFVNLPGNKISAKLPVNNTGGLPTGPLPKTGDSIKILITYLGSSKIIIEKA